MTTGRLVSDKSALSHDIYQLEVKMHQQINEQQKKKKSTIRLSRQSNKGKLERLAQSILPFKENYVQALNELADNLWGMSSYLFKQLSVEDLKKSKQGDIASDSYLAYFNASNNLSAFVVNEVLRQPDVELALIVMGRWAYILKNLFERNDFFSAAAISAGLSHYKLDKLSLEDFLEPNLQQVIKYLEILVSNNSGLFNLQQRKSHDREEVIPALFTLYAMMEKLNGTPRGESKNDKKDVEKHVTTTRRSMSNGIMEMQARLKLLRHAFIKKLAEKYSEPDVVELADVAIYLDQKSGRKCISVFQLLELSVPEDHVYQHYIKLSELLLTLRNHALSQPVNSGLQTMYAQLKSILENNGLSYTARFSGIKKIELKNYHAASQEAFFIVKQMKEAITDILRLKPERHLPLTSSVYGQVFPGQEKMSIKNSKDNALSPAKTKKVKKGERRWTLSFSASVPIADEVAQTDKDVGCRQLRSAKSDAGLHFFSPSAANTEEKNNAAPFSRQRQSLHNKNAAGDELVGELKRTLTVRGLKNE